MDLFKLVKDIVILPIDIILDSTFITPMIRSVNNTSDDSPFGTVDRLRKIGDDIFGSNNNE
jgi:hypothetical protein